MFIQCLFNGLSEGYMCSILSVVNLIRITNCFLLLISTQAIHIITSFNHKHMIHSSVSTDLSSIVFHLDRRDGELGEAFYRHDFN